MHSRETLTMSRKEAPRVGLLKAWVAGRVTGREVAAALRLSERQVHRLRRRLEAEGTEGLVHRSRGQPSPRRLDGGLRQRVAALLMTRYRDFNDCHATEKLQEVEGLAVSRATLHRWRRALGRPSTGAGPGSIGPAAGPRLSTATASMSSSATTRTGPSRKSCAEPGTPHTSGRSSRVWALPSSPPARPGQRAHRTPLADPAGSPR